MKEELELILTAGRMSGRYDAFASELLNGLADRERNRLLAGIRLHYDRGSIALLLTRVKQRRKQCPFANRDLALLADVSESAVSQWFSDCEISATSLLAVIAHPALCDIRLETFDIIASRYAFAALFVKKTILRRPPYDAFTTAEFLCLCRAVKYEPPLSALSKELNRDVGEMVRKIDSSLSITPSWLELLEEQWGEAFPLTLIGIRNASNHT